MDTTVLVVYDSYTLLYNCHIPRLYIAGTDSGFLSVYTTDRRCL